VVLNADLIETVESVPDTVITLTTGRKLVVKESVAELVERVVAYKQRIHDHLTANPQPLPSEGKKEAGEERW
jgi:flagellar protein FlbD